MKTTRETPDNDVTPEELVVETPETEEIVKTYSLTLKVERFCSVDDGPILARREALLTVIDENDDDIDEVEFSSDYERQLAEMYLATGMDMETPVTPMEQAFGLAIELQEVFENQELVGGTFQLLTTPQESPISEEEEETFQQEMDDLQEKFLIEAGVLEAAEPPSGFERVIEAFEKHGCTPFLALNLGVPKTKNVALFEGWVAEQEPEAIEVLNKTAEILLAIADIPEPPPVAPETP